MYTFIKIYKMYNVLEFSQLHVDIESHKVFFNVFSIKNIIKVT